MAAKINWHRYGTKLRHCHPMYTERDKKKMTDRKTPLEVSLTIFHVFVNGGEFDLSH